MSLRDYEDFVYNASLLNEGVQHARLELQIDQCHDEVVPQLLRVPRRQVRGGTAQERPPPAAAPVEAPPPGQTALFNSWEDAVECARCGGRMVRTGSCYTCRDCGTNTGCS